MADPASIARAFETADTAFDRAPIDVLICCAAFSRAATFLEVAQADLDDMIAVNVRGTFLCGQEAGRRMCIRGRGHIVVITSIAAVQAWARESVYCLTKAAQAGLVQAMAIELASFGILVNAVAPGIVDVKSKGMAGTREGEVLRHEMERFPLGRFGAPEEIAEAVHHLAGVTWMTGQTIYADGGFLAAGLAYFGEAKHRLTRGSDG
jgi:3-oxoacyl-[acyl-carrier protein] reductase